MVVVRDLEKVKQAMASFSTLQIISFILLFVAKFTVLAEATESKQIFTQQANVPRQAFAQYKDIFDDWQHVGSTADEDKFTNSKLRGPWTSWCCDCNHNGLCCSKLVSNRNCCLSKIIASSTCS